MSSARDPKPVLTGYPAALPPATHHTAATAYPYLAPPPPPASPFYGPSFSNPSRPDTRLLRRFLVGAVVIFLLIGAATLVLWLVLRPRLPEFSVTSASASAFNLSSSGLSADFDLTLAVRNPNKKMGAYYQPIFTDVIYGGEVIAETRLPGFYQGERNATTIRARLAAVGEYVGSDEAKGITDDRPRGNGAMGFDVRLIVWVRFKAGAWTTRKRPMKVYCEGVRISFTNATAAVGSMVGPPKQCMVNL